MRIQIISYDKKKCAGANIINSTLSEFKSLDDFEFNIIDISSCAIWIDDSTNSAFESNYIADFRSIKKVITSSPKSCIIYVLPKNEKVCYQRYSTGYRKKEYIKDILETSYILNLSQIINLRSNCIFTYQKTDTTIGGYKYTADFSISYGYKECVTYSDKSEKTTTIKLDSNVFMTTLNLTEDSEHLLNFIDNIFLKSEKTDIPEWVLSYDFADDKDKRKEISTEETIIKESEAKIALANDIISKNLYYKTILYTNGEELSNTVMEILDALLDVHSSDFVDVKKEDFLIEKNDMIFIGEIKGIGSNVKSANISQLEVHYHNYLDALKPEESSVVVKQILIINPLIKLDVMNREAVHQQQIDLAKRNDALIIETSTLLVIFEKYKKGELVENAFFEVLKNEIGLLKIDSLNKSI